MIEQQQKLILSPYIEIYELVVPKDNLLRHGSLTPFRMKNSV